MSNPYEGQDPLVIAQQAERDLNSQAAKTGANKSLSGIHSFTSHSRPHWLKIFVEGESGVDEGVTTKFPGSTVKTGSQASGAGDNREIPVDEGGDLISKPGEKGGSGQYVTALRRQRFWGGNAADAISVLLRHETLKGQVDRRPSNNCMRRRTREMTMSVATSGRTKEHKNRETMTDY